MHWQLLVWRWITCKADQNTRAENDRADLYNIYSFAQALHFAEKKQIMKDPIQATCDPLKSSLQILKNKAPQRASLESEVLAILSCKDFCKL